MTNNIYNSKYEQCNRKIGMCTDDIKEGSYLNINSGVKYPSYTVKILYNYRNATFQYPLVEWVDEGGKKIRKDKGMQYINIQPRDNKYNTIKTKITNEDGEGEWVEEVRKSDINIEDISTSNKESDDFYDPHNTLPGYNNIFKNKGVKKDGSKKPNGHWYDKDLTSHLALGKYIEPKAQYIKQGSVCSWGVANKVKYNLVIKIFTVISSEIEYIDEFIYSMINLDKKKANNSKKTYYTKKNELQELKDKVSAEYTKASPNEAIISQLNKQIDELSKLTCYEPLFSNVNEFNLLVAIWYIYINFQTSLYKSLNQIGEGIEYSKTKEEIVYIESYLYIIILVMLMGEDRISAITKKNKIDFCTKYDLGTLSDEEWMNKILNKHNVVKIHTLFQKDLMYYFDTDEVITKVEEELNKILKKQNTSNYLDDLQKVVNRYQNKECFNALLAKRRNISEYNKEMKNLR